MVATPETVPTPQAIEVFWQYGRVFKRALNIGSQRALANEARFLGLLGDTLFVPRLYSASPTVLEVEDLGHTRLDRSGSSPVSDEGMFRQNCIRLLHQLRARGVRHGDLTAANILVRDDSPVVVDFHESRLVTEEGQDKRPEPDAYHLWTTFAAALPDISGLVRRWLAIRNDLGWTWDDLEGKTLLDLGSHRGELCAMARAEGAQTMGVESSDAAETADQWWGNWGCRFTKTDVSTWGSWRYDIVLMLSPWPYLVLQRGRAEAEGILTEIAEQAGVLYFESQLYGDGPGPDFLRNDEDVGALLRGAGFGDVRPLATIPAGEHSVERTVWACRKNLEGRAQ